MSLFCWRMIVELYKAMKGKVMLKRSVSTMILLACILGLIVTLQACKFKKNYPNATLLVSTEQLQRMIDAKTKNMVIIDVRDYGDGSTKIPGSINLRWKEFMGSSGLKSVAELEAQLGAAGLTRDAKIIIYDTPATSWGAAGHMFWMLEYLGCDDVHILNGGFDKWADEGRATEWMYIMQLAPATFTAAVRDDRLATKDSISAKLNDPKFSVIDSRTFQEYNGFQLYGEARGGHIKGAFNLAYNDFLKQDQTVLDYEDMKAMLDADNITTDKEVSANCTVGIRSGFVYFVLRLMGFKNCSNYAASILDWSADSSKPMEKMANFQALVYPQWVDQLISGENPPTYPGKGYVILYTTWAPEYATDPTDYVMGHIPGAIFMDTYAIENGPSREPMYTSSHDSQAKPISGLQALFGGLGITDNTTVVVYGQEDMSCGRVAWALLVAGVKDVRILNGGYDAWIKYGGAVETDNNSPIPVDFGDSPGRPDLVADMARVKAICTTDNASVTITDDRSWDEFIGASNSYYEYFHELGRIACAKWIGDWPLLVKNDINTFQSMGVVERNWRAQGFSPDTPMIFYCGTGWRSAVYTWYAYLLGWQAANYNGGWYEWSSDPNNPRATGKP